jgi:hypothetical protein
VRTIFVGVEDDLSFRVAANLIGKVFTAGYTPQRLHARRAGGFGEIKGNLEKYLNLAIREPVVLITDLDRYQCAPSLVAEWFGEHELSNFLCFRVAVREIESWLMADRTNFASYLGVSEAKVPREIESENDPKARLISIAKHARKDIRDEIVRRSSIGFAQALGYNDALSTFVDSNWNIDAAAEQSNSLRRAIDGLSRLKNLVEV